MLIVPKWLMLQTSIWQACSQACPDMTTEKIPESKHGKGHVTATTDYSTVQTAAMGQIPRSTERI